jgi:asparagine synthetase B (glutamine-hydrolysing)
MRVGKTTVASTRLLPLALAGKAELRLNPDHVLFFFHPVMLTLGQPLPFVGAEAVQMNTIVEIDSAGRTRAEEGPVRFGPKLTLSNHDLAKHVRDEFEAAVARQSRGARRIGVLTGGGIDSGNLLATAVHNHRHRGGPEVVPLSFDFGGEGDDRPHLGALCRQLGVEPVRIAPAEGAVFGMRDRIVDGQINQILPSAVMSVAMARAREAGVDRVFDGMDSEAIFDADGVVFGDFLLRHPFAALSNATRFHAIGETRWRWWRRMLIGPLARHVLPPFVIEARGKVLRGRLARARAASLPWAGPRLRAFLGNPDNCLRPRPIGSQRARVSALASSPALTVNRDSASRWEIAGGVPISRPYLDDEFLQFMGRVPSAAIFAGARDRGLLRESMAGRVPETLRNRMDKSRPREALASAFAALRDSSALSSLLSMRELEALGIVDARSFRSAFDDFAADPLRDDAAWIYLWAAISGEAHTRWFREFMATQGPRQATREFVALPQ